MAGPYRCLPDEDLRTADAALDDLEPAVRLFRLYPFPRASSDQVVVPGLTDNESYVRVFLPPRVGKYNALVCAGCGTTLTGMLGSFTHGIAWGEGYCSQCNWPARNLHRVGAHSVIAGCLQYHPEEVRFHSEDPPDQVEVA